MGRLIDADQLEDVVTKANEQGFDITRYEFKRIELVLFEFPTVDAEPRWIPIEQDCPKMGKDVLISHNGVVSIDWLTQSEGVGYFFVSGVAVQDIDAWMPLPEPYKEKNDEQTD